MMNLFGWASGDGASSETKSDDSGTALREAPASDEATKAKSSTKHVDTIPMDDENEDPSHKVRFPNDMDDVDSHSSHWDLERAMVADPVVVNALATATQCAGQSSPAVLMMEVWLLDLATNQLVLEPGCVWVDPSLPIGDTAALSPQTMDDAVRLPPGVCLAGVLWSTTLSASDKDDANNRSTKRTRRRRRASFQRDELDLSGSSLRSQNKNNKATSSSATAPSSSSTTFHPQRKLRWRTLDALLSDPDTSKTSRLQQYRNLSLDRATGVPFHVHGHAGMVVYLTSQHNLAQHTPHDHKAHQALVDHQVHDAFLIHSAVLLGTTVAMVHARNHLRERQQQQEQSSQPSSQPSSTKSPPPIPSLVTLFRNPSLLPSAVWRKLHVWGRKLRGGGQELAPPMTSQQSVWTWVGTFLTLLVLAGINQGLVDNTPQRLLIGPFGAAMTLIYGLSSAPASQPRNMVFGQVVSGAVSIGITKLLAYGNTPLWFQQAFGPAFAITAMCRLGIPHPPAGAHAVLYASGDDDWALYGIVCMSAVVCAICATLINNLSDKRQYPTYWGFLVWDPHVLTVDFPPTTTATKATPRKSVPNQELDEHAGLSKPSAE